MNFSNTRYNVLRTIFQGKRLPFAFVDLNAFDANVEYVATWADHSNKTIRLGTKSIRCEPLMRRILDHSHIYQGFLTYTVEETAFLASKGHDDFIVAYPSVQPSDLTLLSRLSLDGKRVAMMVDSLEQLKILSKEGLKNSLTLSACIEIDLAFRPLGKFLHLGLRRSPIRTPEQALDLFMASKTLKGVRIDALMGYEGHIAGVNDAIPNQTLKNTLKRALKKVSVKELTRRRQAVVKVLQEGSAELRIVNGGGSGSLVSTLADHSITEATVGSGFFAPGLFHHFFDVQYQPAAFFALQIVRKPALQMIACQGGGYIASGPTDKTKAPLPVMPLGLQYLPMEGAGEVSTPLVLPKDCPRLEIGNPIFFQHAKAGELCERFNELYLVHENEILDAVPTYRGEGMNFL